MRHGPTAAVLLLTAACSSGLTQADIDEAVAEALAGQVTTTTTTERAAPPATDDAASATAETERERYRNVPVRAECAAVLVINAITEHDNMDAVNQECTEKERTAVGTMIDDFGLFAFGGAVAV